jgi:hypothetical protein
MSKLLQEVEQFSYEVQELNEDGMPKKFKLRGIFQKGDTPNGNGRSYPGAVLESAVTSVQNVVTEGRMLGELDHPADAKIHLDKVSHKITKLQMENGTVMGEAEVLQTPAGKILESLLKSGVKLGISSRGFGSTKEVNGLHEVQDDYKLVTFDIVSDPSTPGAFPDPVYEHKEPQKVDEQEDYVTNLNFLVDEVLNEDIQVENQEYRHYITSDDNRNMFYIVEGERDSYGFLNFHMSHDYHLLVKKEDEHERIGLNEDNMDFINKIYGSNVYKKLQNKIDELGYNPKSLNLKKEE